MMTPTEKEKIIKFVTFNGKFPIDLEMVELIELEVEMGADLDEIIKGYRVYSPNEDLPFNPFGND